MPDKIWRPTSMAHLADKRNRLRHKGYDPDVVCCRSLLTIVERMVECEISWDVPVEGRPSDRSRRG